MRFNRILLCLLLLFLLVIPASATQQMWTNIGDDSNIYYYGANAHWVRTAGLNNYAYVGTSGVIGETAGMRYNFPYQTTYSAVTFIGGSSIGTLGKVHCILYDSTGAQLQKQIFDAVPSVNSRLEMKMSGGTPKYYMDGVLQYNGGAISTNPSYVEWGTTCLGSGGDSNVAYFDDYVIAEPSQMQMDLPEGQNETIIITKNLINSATAGLAFGENGTIINSNYMTGRWSRGNGTIGADASQPNESIELRHLPTGRVVAVNYTGTGYAGSMTWNIKTSIIDAGLPQGWYGLYRPATGEYGDTIIFKSIGAQVSWAKHNYTVEDEGLMTYIILSGGYFDPSQYNYRLSVLNSYYEYKQNTTLTESSGTNTYKFTESDTEGVYHAWLIATDHSGYDYIIGTDYTNLVAFFGYGGKAYDCYSAVPLEGVNITFIQGSAIAILSSGPDGNYTTDPIFSTGAEVFINATNAGYNPYQYSWVPLASRTVSNLNVSICPSDIYGVEGGLGIGGVIRDKTIGRPIENADVWVFNITNGQFYTKKTNPVGGYKCDTLTLCGIVAERLYFVNASKIGYNTSIDYPVVVHGGISS
jgi:hypothetical protein